MSSPSNLSSPSTPAGSPAYRPLEEGAPSCDYHSLFCDTVPSTSSGVAPAASTPPAPLSPPQVEAAVSSVKSTTKRKHSTPDDEQEVQPRKRTRKTRHCEETSRSRKRTRTPSSSSDDEGLPSKKFPVQCPKGMPSWEWAYKYNTGEYIDLKKRFNKTFLKKLQQDLIQAQAALSPEDYTAGKLWEEVAPKQGAKQDPIVLFERLQGSRSRLDWNKLAKALSYLSQKNPASASSLIEQTRISKAINWLKVFIKNLDPLFHSPRTLVRGEVLTYLCGQALAVQDIHVSEAEPKKLTDRENRFCFISGEDFPRVLENPQALHEESAVCFCRHHDGPRLRGKGVSEPRRYPIQDFEKCLNDPVRLNPDSGSPSSDQPSTSGT